MPRSGRWPPRRYGWVAHYTDGSRLHEVYDAPPLTLFQAVENELLARFSLVDLWPGGEGDVVVVDCQTGTLQVRGSRIEFELGEVAITGRDDPGCDVVQYKEAHAEWRPGVGPSGTVVDAHVVGYERDLPELCVRVLARLDVPSRCLSVRAHVRPTSGLALAREDFRVLVDGERVTSMDDLQDTLGLPGPQSPQGAT